MKHREHEPDRGDDDGQLVSVDGEPERVERQVRGVDGRRDAAPVGAVDELDHVPDDQRSADRRDEDRDPVAVPHRLVERAVERQRDGGGGRKGHEQPDEYRDRRREDVRPDVAGGRAPGVPNGQQRPNRDIAESGDQERDAPAGERPGAKQVAVREVREREDAVRHREADSGEPDYEPDHDPVPEVRAEPIDRDRLADRENRETGELRGGEVDEQQAAEQNDEEKPRPARAESTIDDSVVPMCASH